jgi:hypothetical protein
MMTFLVVEANILLLELFQDQELDGDVRWKTLTSKMFLKFAHCGEVCRDNSGWYDGRGPLGRPRRRWVDNIRMDLQEVGCGYVDWIGLAQDRDRWRTLVSTVMNLRVP